MLTYTGERVIPELMNPKNGLLKEHVARYRFASKYIWGRVLDLACGTGYGSKILLNGPNSWAIKEIVGVDIDPKTIRYAQKKYSFSKTKYIVEDALDLSLSERIGKFNCIVSFETIEHINDDQKFISNLKNLLLDNGKLIISTPLGLGREYPCNNPFHYFQYTFEEFKIIMDSNFSKVKYYLQKDIVIEKPMPNKQYYLAIAICEK